MKIIKGLLGFVALMFLVSMVKTSVEGSSATASYRADGTPSATAPKPTVIPPEIAARAAAVGKIKVADMKWRKGGFGVIPIADLTIDNQHTTAVKDVRVVCEFYAKSGTLLARKTETIYDVFPAKKKKIAKEVNLGFVDSQVASGGCEVSDFTLM